MSMKASLARMVSSAMQNQQRLKQKAKETVVPTKAEIKVTTGGKPTTTELSKMAATPCSTGPRSRFSPPPVDLVSSFLVA